MRHSVLVVGASKVGKSTLIHQLINKNPPNDTFKKTYGTSINILKVSSEITIEFSELSDLLPQNQYSQFSYVNTIICMYDINKLDSFLFIKNIVEDVFLKKHMFKKSQLMFIANKVDLREPGRENFTDKIMKFIRDNALAENDFIQISVIDTNPGFICDKVVQMNTTPSYSLTTSYTRDNYCSICSLFTYRNSYVRIFSK